MIDTAHAKSDRHLATTARRADRSSHGSTLDRFPHRAGPLRPDREPWLERNPGRFEIGRGSKVANRYWTDQDAPADSRAGCQSGEVLDSGPPRARGQPASKFLSAPNLHSARHDLLPSITARASLHCDGLRTALLASDAVFDVAPPVHRHQTSASINGDWPDGPERPQVFAGLKRMDALLKVSLIRTGHGPCCCGYLQPLLSAIPPTERPAQCGENLCGRLLSEPVRLLWTAQTSPCRGIGKADSQGPAGGPALHDPGARRPDRRGPAPCWCHLASQSDVSNPAVDRTTAAGCLARQAVGWPSTHATDGNDLPIRQHRPPKLRRPGPKKSTSRRCGSKRSAGWQRLSALEEARAPTMGITWRRQPSQR